MKKKVSVIIPFYNRVEWLCEAVQSALDQTYKNLEIIVVNDGSSENVKNFLNKYGNKIIYKYKANGGPASARNLAIKISTGDYIAFLDSDDIWFPSKTEKQIAFMERNGAMWSHTGFYFWFPNSNKFKLVDVKNNYDDVFLQSFVSLRISTPSVIINKKCFNEQPELQFPENMRYSQDTVLYQKLSSLYPLALVLEPLMKVRIRGNNAHLKASLRINVRTQMYCELKNKENKLYNNLPRIILFIYKTYTINKFIITKLSNAFKFSNKFKELLSKLLWIFPFLIERIYARYIVFKQNKDKKYLLN